MGQITKMLFWSNSLKQMRLTEKYSSDYLTSVPDFKINTKWILQQRGHKNPVAADAAYAYLVEDEYDINGHINKVATIFLTNRECPFKCLMCDLWQNTLDHSVAVGDIPLQIARALSDLPPAKHLKLYNSGNFFDKKAIPVEDYAHIAKIAESFESVLIEAHPSFIGQPVIDFQKMLKGNLQVAMGLETTHPEVMQQLNKQMTLKDFSNAVQFLKDHEIPTRAFILLRPPFLSEEEGVLWAKKSIDFAFDAGVECAVIIPTRPGNGAVDRLEEDGYFNRPSLSSLEEVLKYGIALDKGRVMADLWDIEQFSSCQSCLTSRTNRMEQMNLTQQILPSQPCEICGF